ncbi:RagB/SusD family nutrient uptake outer membrane protein, partial [Cellulophaga fucicola]|uniref:RagB/SusD family nutrient uptake outer membrane protein n=1 Tax=Cellulophaga fucicola TaxID=76595 RepID=UPI003EC01800
MKNLFIKKITLLLGVVMLCTGCSDYLSELPDGRTLVDSPEKISELITGAYPNANFMLMAEIMSDNVSDKGVKDQTVDIEEVFYSWGVTTFDTRDTPTQYWNSCYKAISQANQALVSIEELGDGTLSAQRGEALLARAYAHFMLVNFWGKSYNPATANTDLGIPYVLEPETVLLKDYKRNTVAEVYELIE